jgi:dihydrodipicolinate synthase/N-acetylneuraminate lyase
MNPGQLPGVIPAVLMPPGPDRSAGRPLLESLTDHLAGQRIRGIMAEGGTGEFPHPPDEERAQAARATVSGASARIPVVAGTAARTARGVLRQAGQAAGVGAAAVMSVPPSCFPLPDTALADGLLPAEAGQQDALNQNDAAGRNAVGR